MLEETALSMSKTQSSTSTSKVSKMDFVIEPEACIYGFDHVPLKTRIASKQHVQYDQIICSVGCTSGLPVI